MTTKALVTHHHINVGWSVCMSISYTLRETPWGIPPQYRDFSSKLSHSVQRAKRLDLISYILPASKILWFQGLLILLKGLPHSLETRGLCSLWVLHRSGESQTMQGDQSERKKGPCSPNLSSASPAAGSTSACKSSPTLEAIMEPGSHAKEGCALE